MMPFVRDGATSDAQVGFFFHVVVGTNVLGEFRAVRGFGREVQTEEIREGGRNHGPHLRFRPGGHSRCTLESGTTAVGTMFDWIGAVDAGRGFKRLVTIVQLTRDMMPMRFYYLFNAFPIHWEGPALNANESGIDTEQVELVYESMTVISNPVVAVTNLLPDLATAPAVSPDLAALDLVGAAPEAEAAPGEEPIVSDDAVEEAVPAADDETDERTPADAREVTPTLAGKGSGTQARLLKSTAGKGSGSAARGLYNKEGLNSTPGTAPTFDGADKDRQAWRRATLSNGHFVPAETREPVRLSAGVFLSSIWDDEA